MNETPRRGIADLGDDLLAQRDFLAARAPVHARLLEELHAALDGPLAQGLARAWAGRAFAAFYHRPLLLLAALRYDALSEGAAHPLARALAHEPPDPSAVTPAALRDATVPGRERFWSAITGRTVQTNETSRAVAWLLPAHLVARSAPGRDVALVDLGASAGLNLIADELPFRWTVGSGPPLELSPLPRLTSRLGLDIAPLDARDPESAQWLRACTWPGDLARAERLEQAIETFRRRASEPGGPRLERCALQDAARRLRGVGEDSCVLAVQTIVRDYLPPAEYAAYAASMRAWIAERAARGAVWLVFEVDDAAAEPERSAVLTATLARRDGELLEARLARSHPHPGRIWLDEDGIRAFQSAFSGR